MKSRKALGPAFALAAALLLTSGGARAANNVTSLSFFVEPPTLNSIGLEWRIDGDDNRNASVLVQYRKVGDSTFKNGLPMLRLQGERTFEGVRFDVVSPNMFAGSIVDLEPDTDYQLALTLTGPGRCCGTKRAERHRAHPGRAEASRRRTRVPCLPVRLYGHDDPTGVPRAARRLQQLVHQART